MFKGYFGLTTLLATLLLYLCETVGAIQEKVADLTDEVVGLHDNADELLLIASSNDLGDEVMLFSEIKTRIVHHLTAFNGFSADNYFTVNKELVTAILSNFVTYLIILLQFRVGENAESTNQNSASNSTTSE